MKSVRDKLLRDKNKPIVAVITPGSLPVPPVLGGGIQTVAYDYALKNRAHNMVIFSALDAGLPALELDVNGIGHIRIKNKSWHNLELVWRNEYLLRWNYYIFKVCAYLEELRPDIVHIHNRPYFVPLVRMRLGDKVKIIVTNHNNKISGEKYAVKRLAKIIKATDSFIYPSRRIAQIDLLALDKTAAEKTAVIYNGVDENFYKPAANSEKERVLQKYKLASNKNILFVGRLVQEKAVDRLLAALPLVLKEEPDSKLIIVGSSFFGQGQKTPYVKKLIELAVPVKESVVFTGFIDVNDLPVLYSLADLFVSPVNWEDPSPKTIYEAAACQTAILSTKRGGIPEIVNDGTEALLLDSPYETEELAQAMISLLRDPEVRAEMGKNARERMLEKFTIDIIGHEWQKEYERCLHG